MRTDCKVAENIWVARQLLNKRYRDKAEKTTAIIYRSLNKFRKYLHFPLTLSVRVCSFKSINRQGQYRDSSELVEISYKLKPKDVMKTLAHELVHAQQYDTGKLVYKNRVHYFDGVPVLSSGTTYKAYRRLPWEKEAFGKQDLLARQVMKDICDEEAQFGA